MNPKCNRREKFICSNIECATRICSACFDEYRSSTEDVILNNLPMGNDDAELAADGDSEYNADDDSDSDNDSMSDDDLSSDASDEDDSDFDTGEYGELEDNNDEDALGDEDGGDQYLGEGAANIGRNVRSGVQQPLRDRMRKAERNCRLETQGHLDHDSDLGTNNADAGNTLDETPLAPIERVLEGCLLGGNVNPLDSIGGDELDVNLAVPSTTAGEEAYSAY